MKDQFGAVFGEAINNDVDTLAGKRFNEVVSNIPGIVYQFQISPDGTRSLPFVSPKVTEYLGLIPNEVIENVEQWFAITHPDDLASLEKSIIESLENMSQWNWEGRFLKGGKEERWFRGSSNPERLPNGSVVWNGVFIDITREKQAEMEMAINNRDFESLAENSRDGYLVNVGGKHVFANRSLALMLGYEDSRELIGTTIADVVHPSEVDMVVSRAKARAEGADVVNQYETLFITKMGDPLPVELNANVTMWNGRPAGMVSVRDISVRKQAEKILNRSKEELERLVETRTSELVKRRTQFQTLVDNAGDGIYIFGEDCRFSECNRRAREALGYTEEEIIGMSVFDIDPVVVPEQVISRLNLLTPGDVAEFEGAHKRKDGTSFPVEIRTTTYFEDDRKYFIAIARDVSARYEYQKKLEDSEERLRSVFEAAGNVSFITTDLEGQDSRILSFSPGAEKMFGYRKEEIIGKPASLLHLQEDVEKFPLLQEDLKKSGKGFSGEATLIKKIGKQFPALFTLHPVRDSNGEVVSALGVSVDISDRKRAEEKILIAKEEAEHANKAKSEFMARMSHELRTPMNAILGFGQLLQANSDLDSEQMESLQHILDGGHHLLQLIDDVLDISRVDSGEMKVELETIQLDAVIERSIQMVRPLAEEKGIILDDPRVQENISVLTDEKRLKQVLVNLISNAVKYNKESGLVTVSVETVNKSQARIAITDTGIGIKAEDHVQLFEPFTRVGGLVNRIEGTGIGLTISKKIVERIGGSIGFESRFGEGSTFWVDLPLSDVTKGTLKFADNETVKKASGIEKLRILYVEDNLPNMRLMQKILNPRLGQELLVANTAEEGIDLARREMPDLILMDISLPGMDGLEALRTLRADSQMAPTPIIAVSANAMRDQIQAGLEAGFDDYISKPVDQQALLESISRLGGRTIVS